MTMGRKRITAAHAQKLPENIIVDIFVQTAGNISVTLKALVPNGTSIKPVKKNGFSDLPLPFLKGYNEFGEEPKLRYAGSFNGLVCLILHRWGEYWVLWNPATSQFSFAPPPILPQRDCFCNGARPHRVIAGFGYDSADYKSVRVSWWEEDGGGGVQVEVLSWAKRSWTEIRYRSLDTILTLKRQESWSFQNLPVATSNGGVYWMDTGTGMVLCFKLHDEKLGWISTPDDDAAAASSPSWSVLRTINGSPCIPEAIWRVNGQSLFLLYINCIACDSSTGAARLKLPFHVISRAFEFAGTLVPIPGS
ncbi:unnamed protein product [Linum trigynum]|uniref:F-box associated beta-propeller type 3 domain-containing protein n=1 Tax=Linum trigynum TaxID=586398 RepID=A0AAV2D1G6_9ROSI